MAKFSLKVEAHVWWESMGRAHARDGVLITYEIFKTEFKKKYLPNVVRDKKAA